MIRKIILHSSIFHIKLCIISFSDYFKCIVFRYKNYLNFEVNILFEILSFSSYRVKEEDLIQVMVNAMHSGQTPDFG